MEDFEHEKTTLDKGLKVIAAGVRLGSNAVENIRDKSGISYGNEP